MKPNKILFIFIAILVIDCSSYSQLSAAVLGKYKNGYVTSVSYGVARQFSDIPSAGGGWGANVAMGKILYYEKDKALSFDLLGNLFFNSTKGLEINEVTRPFSNTVLERSDYDLYYMNHKTSVFGLGIEGKLTYNKYRSLQRWYAAFLLGGNLGIFSVKMNMQDATGNSYATQFEQIKNLKRDEKRRQLKEMLDNKYESSAEGFTTYPLRFTLMPSVGLEFGYDITRFLTVFAANKLYLGASNRIDGEVNVDDKNDMINYLSLGLKVYFGKRPGPLPALMKYEDVPSSRPASRPVHGYEIPKEVESYDLPEVKIIIPEERSFVSEERLVNVKARISNISSALDVYCKVNEDVVPFDFSRNFVTFTAELKNGENRIQVYGKNDQGQSRDVITVYYYGQDIKLPVVNVTEPAESRFKSPDEIITIRAIVENVSDSESIIILANGYSMKSFVFNPETNEFRLRVRLAEGVNSFELKAGNEAGTVSKEFDIYYNIDIPDEGITDLPDIVIISPDTSLPLNDNNDFIDFKASVKGVSDRSDITMTINGQESDNFSYDNSTGMVSDRISLSPGETVISVKASNIFGESSNQVRVLFEGARIDTLSSVIEFVEVTDPDEFCNTNITVRIRGAVYRDDVKLFLNQLEIRNFAFIGTSHTLRSSLFLEQGNNVIEVNFNNNGVTENEFFFIRCGVVPDTEIDDDGTVSEPDSIRIPLPEIRESFPLDFSKVETEKISFRANIAYINSRDNIRLWHNDEPVLMFDYSDSFRELRADLTLIEGVNKIQVKAENETGEASKVIIVTYEEPLAGPPAIMVNSPRNGFSTEDNTTVFRATIQNIKKMEDVLVTLNGAIFTDYNFDENRGIIFGYVPLRLGENKLSVEAVNRLGSDSEEVVFYSRKEHLPAVRIVSPRTGVIMSMAFVPIEAIVQNVRRSNDASITVNGVLHRSVRLDNEKLTSNVPIKRGENTIILRVVNDHGSASDTIRVSYEGPPEPPVITFLNPAASGTIVNTSTLKFEARVEGIRHSSNVELLLNGQQIEGLRFFRNENKITADLKLSRGMNIISIKATNDTGTDEKSLRVDRQ